MKIVYMGTPDFAVPPLAALVQNGYEVTAVVTQPDKPKGRGKTLLPTPVKEEAMKHDIPVYQPLKVREPEFVETLKKLEPDMIIVAAFGQIIPKTILDMPKYGCLNIHAGAKFSSCPVICTPLKADCWRKSLPPLLHTRHWLPNPPMLLLLPDHIHRKLLYLPQTCFLIKARR